MNSCTFCGRLGRDSEVKEVGDNKLLSFTLASDTGYGQNKSTIWMDCSIWGERGAKLADYLKKGTSATVIGSISEREYQNKEGQTVKALQMRVNEIDFNNPKPSGGDAGQAMDDEIPF
jgi:single-strand DNA-binding protein